MSLGRRVHKNVAEQVKSIVEGLEKNTEHEQWKRAFEFHEKTLKEHSEK